MGDFLQIEKDVPLPDDSRGNASKYPWRKMEVGDSFVMSKSVQGASSRATQAAKAIGNGVKFACRSLSESETRIWRVA